jgi:16S rRNA processing protein RimM
VAPKRESESSSRSSTDALRIGRVGRPHGNDGAFTVSEPTDRLELLDAGRRVTVAGREAEVRWRKGTAQRPLVKLEGTDTRAQAEELRGEAILVPRTELAPLAAGEFLVDDLVGCAIVDGARTVGTVREVLVLPAADALDVEDESGERVLVPLVADAVRSVDLSARRIDVDMGFVSADGD